MPNQSNTEDGNEWLDNILDKYFNDGGWDGNGKEAIQNYIQSNYILKSDVEKIIGTNIEEPNDDCDIDSWKNYDNYICNVVDFINGYNIAKSEQRNRLKELKI